MINTVASTIQVDVRLQCMTNCTMSPICDSYNYRPSDNTCQLPICDSYNYSPSDNTCQLDTDVWVVGLQLPTFRQDVPVQHGSVTSTTTVLQTRRASSTPICDSYNYRPSDNTCQLNTHDTPLVANSADIVYDSNWTWGSPIFCQVKVVWTAQNVSYNAGSATLSSCSV